MAYRQPDSAISIWSHPSCWYWARVEWKLKPGPGAAFCGAARHRARGYRRAQGPSKTSRRTFGCSGIIVVRDERPVPHLSKVDRDGRPARPSYPALSMRLDELAENRRDGENR